MQAWEGSLLTKTTDGREFTVRNRLLACVLNRAARIPPMLAMDIRAVSIKLDAVGRFAASAAVPYRVRLLVVLLATRLFESRAQFGE
jgi:hypothetical protein